MKRFKATISVGLSAENEKEAQTIIKQIVESGMGTTKRGTFTKIFLSQDAIIEELPF